MRNLHTILVKPVLKLFLLLSVLIMPSFLHAATGDAKATGNSLFLNPLFLILISMVLIFLVIIIVLGKALANIALFRSRHADKTAKIAALLLGFILALSPSSSYAQGAGAELLPQSYSGVPAGIVYLLVSVLLIEMIVVFTLFAGLNRFLKPRHREVESAFVVKKTTSFWQKYIAAAPVESDEEKMTDHLYDGIRELDNGMPPWLQYMFIGTVIFAIGYLVNYHVWKTSPLQMAEYKQELVDAEAQLVAFQKKSANRVDETNVTKLTDAAQLKEGLQLFKVHCTACHGQLGEGTVGPNLTDSYWIHGGNIRDLFKTIKYGVVEKGMKSWQAELSPSQMQLVASYILTLSGTNPPNPKEKQGDFYSESGSMPADSTTAKPDSTAVQPVDSMQVTANK